MEMKESERLSTAILRASGVYSEAAVKFGGVREREFLAAVGRLLGLETVDLERQNPNPDALRKLPASAV